MNARKHIGRATIGAALDFILSAERPVTRGEIAESLGLGRHVAGRALNVLVDESHIERVGTLKRPGFGGGRRPYVYVPAGSAPPPPAPVVVRRVAAAKPKAPAKSKLAPKAKAKAVPPPAPPAPPTEHELRERRLRAEILAALDLGAATHPQLVGQLYRDRHHTLARLQWLVEHGHITKAQDGRYQLAQSTKEEAA